MMAGIWARMVVEFNGGDYLSNSVKLYGGVTYHLFGIDEGSHSDNEEFKQYFTDTKLGSYAWNTSTKLLANFNNNLNGGNYGGNFKNIKRFKIYKTIGNKNKLYKVAETNSPMQRIVEDFTVGDLCDYQYYIYAVCDNVININGEQICVETLSPIISEPIKLKRGVVSVIGLTEVGKNTYAIDEDNVWQLQLNVTNDGYTLNTDKTFYQTQNTYGKSSGGNRKQRSIPIKGLLGKINCSNGEYTDTYDDILDWENFAASNSLKMLIDLRGIITFGEINIDPSIGYENTSNHEASVSFTFNQLNSIDNIDVLGRVLPINPIYYTYLAGSENALLKDINNVYLAAPRNEVT